MNIEYTIIVLLLLLLSYTISKYTVYYNQELNLEDKEGNEDNKEYYIRTINNMNIAQNIIMYLCLAITLYGFIIYYYQKKHDFKGKFSIIKFIFGIKKCRRLK